MKKPSKKILVIGGIVVAAVIGMTYFSPHNMGRDVLSANLPAGIHFVYEPAKFPAVGSDEAAIYGALGNSIDRRLSFKTTRQKTINGQSFEYNKIVVYSQTLQTTSQRTEGTDLVTTTDPTEISEVVFFLLDGKIVFVNGYHGTRPVGTDVYTASSDSLSTDSRESLWPDSMNDIHDYYNENGMTYQ